MLSTSGRGEDSIENSTERREHEPWLVSRDIHMHLEDRLLTNKAIQERYTRIQRRRRRAAAYLAELMATWISQSVIH